VMADDAETFTGDFSFLRRNIAFSLWPLNKKL
jgi:hypothetical protein